MQFAALRRMALQVHSSMSRAIQPFATESDGDVLYAVSTNKVFDRSLSTRDLAVVASELAWDAVLSSVPKLPPTPTLLTPQPSSKEIQKCAGTYEFYGGGKLSVHVDDGHLTAVFGGNGRIYFDDGKEYRLDAAEGGLFVIDSPARDVIRFEESNGQITELTINPGTWAVSGKRLEP